MSASRFKRPLEFCFSASHLRWGLALGLGMSTGIACEATPNSDQVVAGASAGETGGEAAVAAGPRKVESKAKPRAPGKGPTTAPKPVANDAKAAFGQMLELIDSHYVDAQISEDELYTAAMRGVMDELIQLPGAEHKKINALLSPTELDRLLEGTKGSVVGVGVMIEQVGELLVVRGVIDGGPAAAAGLQAGDRILAVDGKRLNTMSLADAVGLIRGEAQSQVALYVQRDTEEWTVDVTRAAVKVPSVSSAMVDESIGYLRVNAFAEDTAADVAAQLGALGEQGMQALVFDLRECPGGLLEGAVDVAEQFLAPGQRIVSIRGRKGDDDRDAKVADPFDELPVVVLVGPHTASGAEIVAGALQAHARGLVVGQPTFGKGTVEAVHDLDNGWALKLSQARFYSPNDTPRMNNPVQPDFPVAGDDERLPAAAELVADPDAQLRAALKVLRLRAGD